MKNTFKAWRQANGLTQFQAADALGVARSTIARYEAGHTIPKTVSLAMLAIGKSPEVRAVLDGHVVVGSREAWCAFLDASAWSVDTGDLFLLLEDKYDKKTLQAAKDLKEQLTFALDPSHTAGQG